MTVSVIFITGTIVQLKREANMLYDLKTFKKKNGPRLTNTSVSITEEHLKFIEKQEINFSALVRAMIDEMIQKQKQESEGIK